MLTTPASSSTAPIPTVTEKDAAAYIGFTRSYLRVARRQRRGPAFIQVGRSVRYRIVDLDAWLAAHRVETRAFDGDNEPALSPRVAVAEWKERQTT